MEFETLNKRLKAIIKKSIKSNHLETAMEALGACAELNYRWNQIYKDKYLEESIMSLKNIYKNKMRHLEKLTSYEEKSVLFYDGFGFDTRGLALIYIKALIELGYKVYYLVPQSAKNKQTEIDRISKGRAVNKHYFCNTKSYNKQLEDIINVFGKIKPQHAFFYSLPNDVAGVIAFSLLEKRARRYQINLTDHAFWLGHSSYDICIEFRNYGANISNKYRGISKSKIVILPFYPFTDYNIKFEGYPFGTENKRIIFSGGALYKTLDKERTYYKIVKCILENNEDVIFWYAGSGDSTELDIISKKYPGRIFHTNERKDFYSIICNSCLYLNTYPMVGGLMMQYAARAGKIPITLKHFDDGSGLLLNQEHLNIEFNTVDELIEEVNKLLKDENYLSEREKNMSLCVIEPESFAQELYSIMNQRELRYLPEYYNINTQDFLDTYKARWTKQTFISAIASRRFVRLIKFFPAMFFERFIIETKKIIRRKLCK